MATDGSTGKTWIDVQKKTFTGWANNYLKERILKIGDLGTDLEDGVLLINLLEIISSKKILKYNKTPKIRMQKIENNNMAVNFIKSEGLKLVGIGAEDIVDCQLKLILGLIWTLILRYQIQMSESDNSPKAALLEWVRKQVAPYKVVVNNFTDSWCDGRVLCALTDSLKPGVREMNTLTGDAVQDIDRSMDISLEEYEIPKIMDAVDMNSLPDELSVITYVSYFRDYALNKEKRDADALAALEKKRRETSDASQVEAYGPGLEGGFVNKKADFTIKAINYYGEPLANGGEGFTVKVKDAEGNEYPVSLVDNNNGTYDGSYTVAVPQDYTVVIQLDDVDIKNSPFNVKIDGSDPKESNAYGPGLEGGKVGQPAQFKIQGRNKEGESLTQGGDDFTVKVNGPNGPVDATVKDNGDGSYDVEYNPTTGGDHNVEVFLRGEPLAQGPADVKILNSDANNSYCEGPGFEKAQAKRPTEFTIHSVGVDNKPCTAGGDPFQVAISGGSPIQIAIQDNDDGTYTVSYTPEQPGDYEIQVTLNDEPIKDIPKSIHIKPAADPEKSYAEGPGLEGGECFQPSQFKIHAVDPDGVHRTDGGDGFVVTIEGPAPVDPVMVDNGDGTYDVEFEPKEPGEYTINLTLDGDNVNGFPKTVIVKPAPSHEHSYAKGKGLKKAYDNEVAEFKIYAVDTTGKPRTDGGDPFECNITGPSGDVPAKITDNNDGTYNVEYEPLVAGPHEINVSIRGNNIKDMPKNVECLEGADSGSSFGSFTFTVASKNKKGEPKTVGGDRFLVAITGPAEEIQLNAIDNQDGTYTAAYSLVGNGRFNIAVKLNDRHIEGSPFKANIGEVKKNPDVPSFTTTAKANYDEEN
ncbi:hypothetical protein DICPUDRAFT_91322 [Dictyostelium purpureum]|uniref:Calponin-homology (CH) domain-containing protein n=1 Tax=Dictyostelium purpureum TaxID=5786 RepID=F0ZAN3_DICPU|nr:uncharacterized protein DICPUDRAFT_91322 [Dictyostelium purpureum]EGC39028.1 hypothetical protein DICPUDRAFT_91322 [Dictyostelium purpureum]|eukprot:XP_003284481.1 hypothetical protein DICPUDRAFT_91322 [Dictyostelium purpureum]